MTQSSTARKFLAMNGAFSALNGIALLAAATALSPMIFAHPTDWAALGLRFLGAGLLGFAILLLFMSKDRFISRMAVNEIVILDALWVVSTIVLIAFLGHILTATGQTLITVVAIVVAFFAVTQFASATKIKPPLPVADVTRKDGNLIATVKRTVNASPETVWRVMTDHPAYADVASNIAKVEILSGDELGMKRRCYGPKGESWEETCDLFEPGQSFGFRIHTEADDYPYPISELSGRWSVEPHRNGSQFDIEIIAKPKGNVLKRFLFTTLAKQQFKTVLIDLADAWAARMEKKAQG